MQVTLRLSSGQIRLTNVASEETFSQLSQRIELDSQMYSYISNGKVLAENDMILPGMDISETVAILGGAGAIPSGVDPAFYALSLKYQQ
jgi:hypothetical protein